MVMPFIQTLQELNGIDHNNYYIFNMLFSVRLVIPINDVPMMTTFFPGTNSTVERHTKVIIK